MSDYLPPKATSAEAIEWLNKQTGEKWTLARIIEAWILPWFWLDYSPEYASLFGDRIEGFTVQMEPGTDKQRLLENTCETTFLVTMFRTPEGVLSSDGALVRGSLWLPMEALRFAREDIQLLANGRQRADSGDQMTERPKPIPKKLLQSQRIIQTLQEMGIDPNAMPPSVRGQRGHKILVWEKVKKEVAVFVSQEAFNSAWKRMLKSGELKTVIAI